MKKKRKHDWRNLELYYIEKFSRYEWVDVFQDKTVPVSWTEIDIFFCSRNVEISSLQIKTVLTSCIVKGNAIKKIMSMGFFEEKNLNPLANEFTSISWKYSIKIIDMVLHWTSDGEVPGSNFASEMKFSRLSRPFCLLGRK